jgi:Mg2+/citrate symporter
MSDKSDKNFISIPKKAMFGIAPAIAIIAVLLAKDKAPEVLLFLIGISAGVVIGMGFKQGQKQDQDQ